MGPDFRRGLFPADKEADLETKIASLVEGAEYCIGVAGQNDCPNGDFLAAVELVKLIPQLFDKIAHGEAGHREWLKEAIENHFTGKPMPEYKAK